MKQALLICTLLLSVVIFISQTASAQSAAGSTVACQKDTSFAKWMDGLKKDAQAQGVSAETIASALPAMKFDPAIIKLDRQQSVFQQNFLQFSDRMASQGRMTLGAQKIRTNKDLFDRVEKEYGVPPQVIVAFWALETDFSANTGHYSILSAVTTLAYDCRRADFFRQELIDALRILERGDLKPAQMIGNWAGEIGGTQLTPSDYYKYAVDFDGDGKADLIKSIPDTVATAANFLKNHGWVRGQPWLQEVSVPENLPWEEADLTIQHSVAQWQSSGVKAAHGSLPQGSLQASLLLPMGRFGPAFLAYPNFQAFMGWNSSMVYSTTAAYLATRMAGAPAVGRGSPLFEQLSGDQVLHLQLLLNKLGYNVGTADGKLGLATRSAVKQAQLKVGLPADSYPTAELIEKLQGL